MKSVVGAKSKRISKGKESLKFRSLYIFNPTNKLRILVHTVSSSKIFEFFILFSIITSVILLAIQGKNSNSQDFNDPYTIVDFVLNIIFAIEAISKIVAHGFVMHDGAYLRNKVNVFDFIVVLSGTVSDILVLSKSVDKFVSLKFLRLFRVLRPLRLVVKSDNLRVVLDTIIKSFSSLLHVLMFIFLIIILFAISGMELFSGILHTACMNNTSGDLITPITICRLSDPYVCSVYKNSTCQEKWPGMEGGLTSFDNLAVAIVTVIQVITMEDWIFLLYKLNAVASPIITWIYFVTLVLFGGYFAVDLLMGVLGNQYLRTKQCTKNLSRLKMLAGVANIDNAVESGGSNIWLVIQQAKNVELLNRMGVAINTQASFSQRFQQSFNRKKTWIKVICRSIIKHKMFFWVMTSIVVIDVWVSSVYAHITNGVHTSFVYIFLKLVLLFLYFVEALLIWMGKGTKRAFTRGYFIFNSLVFLFAFVELLLKLFREEHSYIGLSVIRTVSLIRVFKYTRFWSQLSTIINSFVESIKGVVGLMMLLFIVLVNYALIGNQLFGKPELQRDSFGTFDNFGSSLLLSFVLLTGDNWTTFMAQDTEEATSIFGKIITVGFYISFVVVGNFILMNVFLGIIVDNLTSDYEENHEENEKEKSKKKQHVKLQTLGLKSLLHPQALEEETTIESSESSGEGLCCAKRSTKVQDTDIGVLQKAQSSCSTTSNDYIANTQNQKPKDVRFSVDDTASSDHIAVVQKAPNSSMTFDDRIASSQNYKPKGVRFSVDDTTSSDHMISNIETRRRQSKPRMSIAFIEAKARQRARTFSLLVVPEITNPIPRHNSLFIFHYENKFRKRIFWLVTSSYFTLTVCFVIVLSSLAMAFDDPLNTDHERVELMKYIDYVFTGFFIMEILAKSIAYGFVFGHQNCYLRKPMNILDTLVVCVSFINLFISLTGHENSVQLRVLRVVRVLRMLKISTQLKLVINCLISSVQKISYFLVLYILILFIYSVIGVHLYKGLLGECSNDAYTTKLTCLKNNSTWMPNQLAFENIGDGMITLFVMSTMDDWFKFLHRLMKLKDNYDFVAILYFVSFILVMSFVMLNVFIGFVIVVFHREKEKEELYKVLDKQAQELIFTALKENPSSSLYIHHQNGIRRRIYTIVESSWFQIISFSLIIFNTGFLMSKHYGQSDTMALVQKYSNIVFTICFTLEILLKLIAVPFKLFIKDPWTVFDTIAVLGSWLDILLDIMNVPFINLSLFRLFRVARLAKIVGKGGNLRQLFATFLKSMKSVPPIAFLLAMILYVYAIIAMEIFGNIRLDGNTAINKDTNFQSFIPAILVMIRVTTLDAWHEIMLTCADIHTPNCENSNGNCGSYFAYIFFASFVLICSYIMTNLFLAVIMENFVYLTHDASTLDCRHIHRFTNAWSKYDKSGSGRISTNDMVELLKVIEPPLGVGLFCPHRHVYSKLMRIRIHVEECNEVTFNVLLLSLVLDTLKLKGTNESIRDDIHNLVNDVDYDLLYRLFPDDFETEIFNKTEQRFHEKCATHVIEGYYKIYKSRSQKVSTGIDTKHTGFRGALECSTTFAVNTCSFQEPNDNLIPNNTMPTSCIGPKKDILKNDASF